MKKLGKRSIESVLAKIEETLKPGTASWIGSAYEWIGEAIGKIGVYGQYAILCKEFSVTEYRLKFPCALDNFIGIRYQGYRLCINPNINAAKDVSQWQGVSLGTDNVIHPTHYYTYNEGEYLKFSFETGDVEIFYFGLPCDENGFPKIPDNENYVEALMWYVLNRMLLRGYKHPLPEITFQYTHDMWEHFMCRARNEVNTMSIDDVQEFMNNWLDPTYKADLVDRWYGEDKISRVPQEPGSPIQNLYGIDP